MYGVLLLAYSVNAADRQLFPLLAHDVRVQYGFSLSDTGLSRLFLRWGWPLRDCRPVFYSRVFPARRCYFWE